MLSKSKISELLYKELWFIRERYFKYPMTIKDVWGAEVRRLVEKKEGNVVEYGEDIHKLEIWDIPFKCKIKSETDILTALQIAKAEVIKFETKKVKQYGDKKCTCYQLSDWTFLSDDNGICVKEVDGENDTYSITVVKYAIILEDLE